MVVFEHGLVAQPLRNLAKAEEKRSGQFAIPEGTLQEEEEDRETSLLLGIVFHFGVFSSGSTDCPEKHRTCVVVHWPR